MDALEESDRTALTYTFAMKTLTKFLIALLLVSEGVMTEPALYLSLYSSSTGKATTSSCKV